MTTYKALAEWAVSGDIGMSSQSIAQRFMGAERAHYDHPHDCGDFGRCYRLLAKVPAISIEIMRGTSPTWDRLVERWPELVAAYEKELYSNRFPEFNQLLTGIIGSPAPTHQ